MKIREQMKMVAVTAMIFTFAAGSAVYAGVISEQAITADAQQDIIADDTQRESVPEPAAISEIKLRFKGQDVEKRKIYLRWGKVEDASRYQVMQYVNKKWKSVKETRKEDGVIRLDAVNKIYRYKIQAYNAEGELVGGSDTIKIGIPAIDELSTTGRSETKVKLSIKKSAIASEYRIYKKIENGKYRSIKTIKKTSLTDMVTRGKKYSYKAVPVYKTAYGTIRGAGTAVSYRNQEFVSIAHQKYSYEEMADDMYALQKKYSDYVRVSVIGDSIEGRHIYDFAIGNPDAGKNLLVVSAIHAREYITTAICMKQAEYYLLHYNKKIDGKYPSEIFRNVQVHYIMMANPDGVEISQTKNAQWKANSRGVNLNRNFPYIFKRMGSVAANDYSGSYAGSEKETQALMAFSKKLKKQNLVGVVNYHAMGNIVFGEYSGNSAIKSKIREMYQTARGTTGYSDAGGYASPSNGNYREYIMYGLKIPCITIEVGNTPCPAPVWQYPSIFNANKLVVLREAALFS